jgi:uncharacterized membrane protein YtjA (UPF0391 family)
MILRAVIQSQNRSVGHLPKRLGLPGTVLAAPSFRRCAVLYWAFMFLVIGLIAAALGFTEVAGGALTIAKFLAGLFLVLFLIFLVLGMTAARKIVS